MVVLECWIPCADRQCSHKAGRFRRLETTRAHARRRRERAVRRPRPRPRGRRRAPSRSRKNMYSPRPCRSGRDSIRVRFTSRSANSARQRTSQPGPDDPAPQNTSAVLKRVAGRPARCRRGAIQTKRVSLLGVVLDVLAQHRAAVERGRRAACRAPQRDSSPSATWRTASAVDGAASTCARAAAPRAGSARTGRSACGCETTVRTASSSSGAGGEQAEVHGMQQLADDHDVLGLEHERVERRVDRALERVLDRHQRAVDVAVVHGQHGGRAASAAAPARTRSRPARSSAPRG